MFYVGENKYNLLSEIMDSIELKNYHTDKKLHIGSEIPLSWSIGAFSKSKPNFCLCKNGHFVCWVNIDRET